MSDVFVTPMNDLERRVRASGSMPGAVISERRFRRILVVSSVGALVGLVLTLSPLVRVTGTGHTPLAGAAFLACVLTAVLLQLRVWVLDDQRVRWLADAFVVTAIVHLLTITGPVPGGASTGAGSGRTAALTLVWHLALLLAAAGQLAFPDRARLRTTFAGAYLTVAVVVGSVPIDPAWLGRSTAAPAGVLAVVLVAHVAVLGWWARSAGWRPSMAHAAITVGFILMATETAARLAQIVWDRPPSAGVALLVMAGMVAPAITEAVSFAKLARRGLRAEGLLTSLATSAVDPQPDGLPAGSDARSALAAIQDLIDHRRFAVALQPIVDLATREPAGYESLARFPGHPDPTPDVVIRQAHAVGLGVELELALIQEALGRLDTVDDRAYLSVNVGLDALVDPRFAHVLAGDLHRVVVEITEHDAIADYDLVNRVLQPLRERGLRVAVDDAGAGFASLRHVVRIRPDLLKLDRSLVARADREPSQRAVLAALIDLAERSGMDVVGEGVERNEELECLMLLGARLGQGYLFGHPVLTIDRHAADRAVPA